MRKVTGEIRTNKVGSDCAFELEVDDDLTDEEIEEIAKQAAYEHVEWNYEVTPIEESEAAQ